MSNGQPTSQTTEEIQAEIARTREDLAQTVDQLTARLDVKARAQQRVRELRDNATDDDGRPTPTTLAVGGAAVAVLVAVVALRIWSRRR